ncbi:MAG: hypothetical protein WC444_04670 [Candidatus Paceibacterota bacterium]
MDREAADVRRKLETLFDNYANKLLDYRDKVEGIENKIDNDAEDLDEKILELEAAIDSDDADAKIVIKELRKLVKLFSKMEDGVSNLVVKVDNLFSELGW